MNKEMQGFRAKCAAEALEIIEPIKLGLNAICINTFVWGYMEGIVKGYCKCVADGIMSFQQAVEDSGCPEEEFRAGMRQYFPDFEC